jgi:predicted O-methyltransferase YrrM
VSWYGSHSFLNEYIREHKCRRILEIGVYTGENARTMVEAALRSAPPSEVEYFGFDFFWGTRLRDVRRKLEPTGCNITLFEGNTVVTLPHVVSTLPKMDVIFIDGGKSYTEASSDWEHVQALMHDGTTVFVHNVDFSGVRSMVDGISRSQYRVEVFHAPFEGEVAIIKKRHRNLASAKRQLEPGTGFEPV